LNRWAFLRGGSGENVVPGLRAAAGRIDQDAEAWQSYAALDKGVPLTDEEVKGYTLVADKYADVLRRMDAADLRGAVDWQPGYTSPLLQYEYPKTDLNGMRALAQLLQADAWLAHRSGDAGRALRRSGQMLALSRAVGHQPQIVPHLVAIGLSALGTTTAGEVVPELKVAAAGGQGADPREVRELIADLLDERPLREGWRRAIVGERVMVVDVIQCLADGRITLSELRRSEDEGAVQNAAFRFVGRGYLLDNAAAVAAYDAGLLSAAEGAADAPAARAALPQALLDEIKTSKRYLMASILTPTMERAVNVHYRCIAERRLVATALAIKLYEADHGGRPPETLEALVPEYLAAVPRDPLATGGAPLGYISAKDDAARPRLYSVGENAVDNGGNEPDPDLPMRVREATSDVVRHLKRQPRVFPRTMPVFRGLPGMNLEEPPAMAPATGPGDEEPAA